MMREAQAVGEALGIRFRIPIEKRIAGGEAVGPHKTSMLQDVEAGRAVEADALIGSVIELGRIVERADAASRRRLCAGQALEQDTVRPARPVAHRHGVTAEIHASHARRITMSRSSTLRQLMSAGADDAPAIAAPGTVPLSYRGLRALVETTIASLNGFGVGRNDRVAIVLPNGPDMATAFIGIASGATAAPLNPDLQGRRVRVLHVGPEGEGAGRRGRQQLACGRRGEEARHEDHRAATASTRTAPARSR